jgi:hypothetical protein
VASLPRPHYFSAVPDDGSDIFTEAPSDADTLANLGPLAPLAGTWEGRGGTDDHPVADGSERDTFIERFDLQPIDAQTNGPQLFYGLRYHTHIVKPGETETFHDQVGYWLWEPAAKMVLLSLAIPRAQVVLAAGPAEPDAREFEMAAEVGSPTFGIVSNPFLHTAFRTVSFRMRVTANADGTWSYEEDAVIEMPGREEAFHHVDRNTLRLVAPPSPNPRARAMANGSLGIGSLRGWAPVR